MKTTINNFMKKLKKTLLLYCLGTAFSFLIMAIIHLNNFLFIPYFGYSHWRDIVTTSLINGGPFGLIIWAFFTYHFSASLIDIKFVGNLLKSCFYNYLIGIFLGLLLISGTELYISFFDADYYYSTYYNIFGFSALLGIPSAIGFHTIKTLKS